MHTAHLFASIFGKGISPTRNKLNFDLWLRKSFGDKTRGFLVMSVWVAAAGHGGRDKAVPRMATQKWLPSRHLHSEPGKGTGTVHAMAVFVKEEQKWKEVCTWGWWLRQIKKDLMLRRSSNCIPLFCWLGLHFSSTRFKKLTFFTFSGV